MGRNFFFSGCAFAFFYLAGLTPAQILAPLFGFLAAYQTALLVGGVLGVLALVCTSLLFGGLGFFNVLYMIAKGVYELAQLLLCAMTLAALVFWFDLGVNFWTEGGATLAVVLYTGLYGAAFSLHVFDFNYPVKEVLLSYSALPFACMALAWAGTLIR